MRLFLTFLIVVFVGSPAQALPSGLKEALRDEAQKIESLCRDKWEDNPTMVLHCRKTQVEALEQWFMFVYRSEPRSVEQQIANNCLKMWRDTADRANFIKTVECTKQYVISHRIRQNR